ncbi:MAG: DUF2330 domain-containing protein [Candidatus Scalindua sp.]|nr:DUF2330 domain-containing protein [Candidatus Scalindua sp.]
MILTVDTAKELEGEKAVWIFPVPAKPDKTNINIVQNFPRLHGYDVEKRADRSISEVFKVIQASQIYTLPFIMLGGFVGESDKESGVTVHESIEKMGLKTELVSAVEGSSLTDYLEANDLTLPMASMSIIDEYIGREFSFVISWISNIETFKEQQKERFNEIGNVLAVSISFPADKIYYPLKLTSVYGNNYVSAIVYVMDYVKPELYDGIEVGSEVNYFFQKELSVPDELGDFFAGYEKEPTLYPTREGKKQGFTVKEVKYTKIKIDTLSEFLNQDLWMERSASFRLKAVLFAIGYKLIYGIFIFSLCSCLASFLSGRIIFKNRTISKLRLTLFGFWNFLTLIGFSYAAYIMKMDVNGTISNGTQQRNVSLEKVVIRTLLFALVFPILWLIFTVILGSRWGESFVYLSKDAFIIWLGYGIFLSPFVWGYYNNRKILMFTVLFSVLFVVLTVSSQVLLTVLL